MAPTHPAMHNDRLDRLTDYPFDRLRALLRDVDPPGDVAPVEMQIGAPRHPPPEFVRPILARDMADWGRYPPPNGPPELRAAIADWLARRYGLTAGAINPDRQIAVVSGTREALFMAALLVVPRQKNRRRPVVAMPNPFYQVYAGAGEMADAEVLMLPATAQTGFQPALDAIADDVLARAALVYVNSPANPQGSIASLEALEHALALARRHDFVLAVDECYAEIYTAEPPPGALEAAARMSSPGAGLDCRNLLIFHSLSKRSNVPGLRSGFVAGDADLIARLLRLRRYAGAQVPLPVMHASTELWRDEDHVAASRALYVAKFNAALKILDGAYGATRPGGAFYLWLDVGDGEAAAVRLWREAAVRVLPGAYLARPGPDGDNPGAAFVRCALVHELDDTVAAVRRIRDTLAG